jgi:hypothetical protein
VDGYLSEQAREAQKVQGELEGSVDTRELRERLRQRRAQAAASARGSDMLALLIDENVNHRRVVV